MNTSSPFLNPLWSDAVWDVSGAFAIDRELVAFHDFCNRNLRFSPFNIVHGSPLFAWNSGRVNPKLIRRGKEIQTALNEYNRRGITLYLTFTNTLLGEQHLNNDMGNALCRAAINHNSSGRNGVILASDSLKAHLRREYPQLRLISSILKITAMQGKGKLDVYKRLADEYDEVMVHPDDVLNDTLLEQLRDKERYILIVNEYCIRNCPLRPFHYETLSRQALDFMGSNATMFEKAQNSNGCLNLLTQLTDKKRGVMALSIPEMTHLRDMGFRHFKLQGRGNTHAGTLLSDLLRLVLRNDEKDENAMHSLSHRFWESL